MLLIEHNRILLDGLSGLLSESPYMELAGAVASGAAGVAVFAQERPTVAIVDLELPDITAVEVVRQIRNLDSKAPILILATYELDAAGTEAITAGATAIIAKDQSAILLVPLIRRFSLPPDPYKHP